MAARVIERYDSCASDSAALGRNSHETVSSLPGRMAPNRCHGCVRDDILVQNGLGNAPRQHGKMNQRIGEAVRRKHFRPRSM